MKSLTDGFQLCRTQCSAYFWQGKSFSAIYLLKIETLNRLCAVTNIARRFRWKFALPTPNQAIVTRPAFKSGVKCALGPSLILKTGIRLDYEERIRCLSGDI